MINNNKNFTKNIFFSHNKHFTLELSTKIPEPPTKTITLRATDQRPSPHTGEMKQKKQYMDGCGWRWLVSMKYEHLCRHQILKMPSL